MSLALGILAFARVSGGQKTSKNHLGSTVFSHTRINIEKVTKKHQKGAKNEPTGSFLESFSRCFFDVFWGVFFGDKKRV